MTSVSTLFNRISLRRSHSWMSRIMVGIGVALIVFALLFANSPTAQGYSISNTDEISTTTGGGGYVGPANCAAGSVVYQIGATGNSSLTSLTLPTGNCADLNNTATAHNSVTASLATANWGGAGDTSLTSTRCASSEAIVGIVAHKQANGYVAGWQLMCGTLPDGSSRTTSSSVFGWSNAGTASPSQRETIQCPTGMVVVGMVANTGSIMDRIGFRCGTITGADQATVTMSSSSTLTYGTSITVTANGGSGNGGISYSATGSCSLSGSTLTATGNAGATCSVTATRAGNTNYNARSSAAQTVTIQRAANTISFANPGTKTWSATPFNVAPSATSGITPSVTSTTPSVCSVSGLSVTMLSSGTCSLSATQGETTNHVAAVAVVQNFTINPTGRTAFTGNSATISGTTTGTKYVVERFTTTGASTWTVPQGVTRIDLLVIGGGGGGGSRHRGGGGAGAYLEGTNYTVTPGTTYNVTVGSGGAGGANAVDGSAGTASQFLTGDVGATANGGGGGAYSPAASAATGSGAGLTLYSYGAGNGLYGTCGSNWCGGGGGGAGQAGANAVSSGGKGGDGRASAITGVNTTYAGGGGGGSGSSAGASCANASAGGAGGSGGGGAGGSAGSGVSVTGTAGTVNTGSGGGGGGYCNDPSSSATGGAGGSGIVVLRYVLPVSATPDLATASDSGASSTDNITTNRTLTFTGSAPVTSSVQLSVATATSATDTDASTGTWTNTGSTCTADATSGAWSCTTAQLAPGLYKVRSTTTTAMDGITDTQTSSTALIVDVDTTAPTIALTRSGAGALTAGQTETITFTLSETSANFISSDVTTSGASISGFTGSGTSYTATFTPTSNTQSGTGSVSVALGTFTDAAGNNNSVSNTVSINYDTSRPSVTISASPASVSSGSTTTVTFTVSESVTTFTSSDISATLGTLTNFAGSGTSYTATFTASPSTGGTAIITVASGSISDASSNANTTAFTFNITVTNTASSSGGRTSYLANGANGTNGVRYFVEQFTTVGTSTWTAPQGVTSVEYLVIAGGGGGAGGHGTAHGGGGGGAGGYRTNAAGQTSGGGAAKEAAFTVTPGTSYSVIVGGGGAGGAGASAGNAGSNSQFSTVIATGGGRGGSYYVGPSAGGSGGGAGAADTLITGSNGTSSQGFKGGDTPTANFTTNGAGGGGSGGVGTNGVNAGPIATGGVGTASNITGTSITRAAGGAGGLGTVSTSGTTGDDNTGTGGGGGSAVSGITGVGGNGASGIVVIRYAVPDVSAPDLDSADDTGTNTDNITSTTTLTFTGSAPVGSSIQLFVDGVASGNTCTVNSTTGVWTCDTDVLTEGDKVITAESTTILSDSTVTSTSSGLTVTIDTTAPTVSTVSFTSTSGSDNTYKIGDTITVTVTFSNNVTVTGSPRIALVGLSSKYATYASGSGTTSLTFTYTVASGDVDSDGLALTANTLSLNSGTIIDIAANNATLTHSAVGTQSAQQVDGVAPTVTISRAGSGSLKSGQTETITFTLSEASTDFAVGDITVSGGSIGTLTSTSSTVYSVVFTPTANTQSGTGSLSVAGAGAKFTDAAGNNNTVSSTLSITYDTAVPTVTITRAGTGSLKSGQTETITFTLSEASSDFAVGDITITGGSIGALTTTSSTVYSVVFTPTTNTDSGTGSISVDGATFTDTVGNDNTASTALSISYDTSLPTVTITRTGSATLRISQTETITFTLSEASANFIASDVTTSGGAISAFTGSGTSYTATFTPTTNTNVGTSSISVSSAKFTDTIGNSNTSSNTLNIAYDTAAPTVSVSANPASLTSGSAATVTFTISEFTTTFTESDVSTRLGTLSNFSGSGATYTATFTASPSTGGTAVITIASGSVTDTNSNASTSAFALNITVTNTTSSPGGRTSYIGNGSNGTNGVRYFVEQFTTVGSSTWTPPRGVSSVDYLVVGGGAAGGTAFNDASAGGGGGGQVQTGTISSGIASSYTITVGSGGAASSSGSNPGGNGGTSTLAVTSGATVKTSAGGSGGSSFSTGGGFSASSTGWTGGGGGSWATSISNGSTGTGGASFKGGNAQGDGNSAEYQTGGGGGGAGGAGTNGSTTTGGSGGSGVASAMTGTSTTYGGGGGGGKRASSGSAGTGTDGGGNGGKTVAGSSGATNRGGGGGGGGGTGTMVGGAGGSGIVVIRYAVPDVSTPDLDSADDTGTNTDNITSATTLTFTGSAPAGSTVQLYVDGVTSGNSCAANSTTGAWSCDTDVLTDGDKIVTAESTTILPDSIVTTTSSGLTVTVDATAPTLSSVSITSNAGTDNTYKTGDTITVTATFSEDVKVTGTPRIALAGLTGKYATYASGTGTSSLTFTYVVVSGDADTDGLSIATDTLSLNSGTITDTAANNATITHTAVSTQSTQQVDGVAPTVTLGRAGSGTLKSGQTETVTLTLSEASSNFAVGDITVSGGTIGTLTTTSSTVYSVVFTPTTNTQAGSGSLSVSGATFTDEAGNNNTASTSLTISYDTKIPTVTNVTSSTANGTAGIGASVSIQVTFSEAVTVTGTPQLELETGATNRSANYASGTGATTLNFTYTVQSGDSTSDLDYASTNALTLNSGTIADAVGNDATLTLATPGAATSLAANKAIVVATTPTQIASVRTPTGTASGAAFTQQPQVSLQDSGGSVVLSDNSTVVTASVSTGASLVGTRTATAINGIVTFNDLGISGTAGTAYTITYSATINSNALTAATQSVTPTVGAATHISVTTQPMGDTAGAALATYPRVSVLDSGDNVVTAATTSITVSASGGTLGGTKIVNAVNGVATFGDLTFAGTAATNYTLTFTTTSLGSATSNNFSVGVGAATKLVLTTDADGAAYDTQFTTQPVLEIRDAGNNKVSTANNVVTATLSSGTVVGTNGASITATASSGTSTFNGLGITGLPGSYTITYSSGALAGTSQSISLVKANQTITIATPANRSWSSTAFALSPSSSSGLSVSISSTTSSICTVAGLDVTMATVGSCSLTATQAGNDYFNAAASVVRSFNITQAAQSISFATPSDRAWSATTFTVSPTATSGLTVAVSSTTGTVCSTSGTTITMLKAGTCILKASQLGNTEYSTASDVTHSFEITLAAQASFTLSSTTATYNADLALTTAGGSGTGSITFTKVSGDCTISTTTLTPTAAGTCVVTSTKAPDTQYASTSDTQTITINRASQTTPLTLADTTVTYGQTLTLSGSGGEGTGNISYAVSSGTCALNGSILTPGDAGSLCKVEVTRTISANYIAQTSTPITITVQQATPSLGTLTLPSKTFGDADFAATHPSVTYNSTTVAGSWSYTSADTTVATFNASTVTVAGGGTSVVTALFTPTDSTNFTTASTNATLTVNKATPTFTWTNVSTTYGDSDFAIVSPTIATTSATGTWSYSSANTSAVTISGSNFDVMNAGSSVITATFTPSNTTNFVSGGTATMTVTVDRANQSSLNISSITGTYGTQLTLTTSGGTTNGSVTWGVSDVTATGCSITSSKLTTTSAGTCLVTAVMAGSSNYFSVSNIGTTVTINAKPITVTATAKTKTYGDNDPALTYTTPAGALENSDTLAGTLIRVAGNTIGEYNITQGSVANSNYDITYVPAKLTINAKPITVTAVAKTKTYGDNDPTLTYTTPAGALENNDTLTGTLTRVAGNTVGEYTINQGSVANSNYVITYVSAKLTINAKPITVTATAKTKTYGDNDPALTYTTPAGALENNDTLTGTLTRDAGEQVDTYTIRRGTLDNSNYIITFVTNTLTITPAQQSPLAVTTSTITYRTPIVLQAAGGTEGALSFDVVASGTANCSIENGTLSATGNAGSTCTVTATRAATLNFSQKVSPVATIIVTRRNISVTATAKTKTYGDADPGFTYVITAGSLYGSDTFNGSLGREVGENVGTYDIDQGTLANNNYTISFVPAQLTITQRPITITATNKTKVFGQSDPALTYLVTSGNIVNSDVLSGSITRAVGETLGNYNITRGTLDNGNYNIIFNVGTFQITGAPQNGFALTASSYSVVYQQSITLNTSGGNGFGAISYNIQNGTGACSVVGNTLTGDTSGTCNVTAIKAAEGGYLEGTSNVITVTVDKAEQVIAFAQLVDQDFSPTPVTISATADSGAPVAISSRTPNVCSAEDLEIRMTDSGTCTIDAEVAASRNYNAAQLVTQSFEIRAVVPFAPTITTVEPGDASISVSFTPGLSGGASITTYRYSVDDGTRWTELPNGTTASPLVIGNLPNNVEARVRIMAVNRVGAGARSNMRASTPVARRSLEWETQRLTNSGSQASIDSTVSNQLPPNPASVKIQSLSGGRRTQITAVRAARDANIPVTYALISIRTRTNKLLARIKVLVDPANPTTSVSVPYASSKVLVSVQFANNIGISSGGPTGVNIAEGNTFEWTTISNETHIKGSQIKGDLFFARGKSTLTYTMQQTLKKMAATAKARGGLIYVSGFAQKGEIRSAWMLEPLARARAESVTKYLAKIGVRQWITFHGTANGAMNGWKPVTGRQVIVTTVQSSEI